MKKYLLWGLYTMSLFIPNFIFCQEEFGETCFHKLEVAADYLTIYEYPDKNLTDEIIKSIEDCIHLEDKNANYIRGLLLLNNNKETEAQKAFSLIESAALQNHVNAMCLLGDLYKDGIGTPLDFDKALKWYKKASNNDNQKAAFKIGYLYLKGLGSVKQDYTKAVEWFSSSTYPMAKHWLAICYKSGYGVEQNLLKAKQILQGNDIENSHYLLQQLEEVKEVSQAIELKETKNQFNPFEEEINSQGDDLNNSLLDITEFDGSYVGKWIEYDWSGTHIVRTTPVELKLDFDSYEDRIDYNFIIGESEYDGEAIGNDNEIYFENLSLSFERYYKDHPTKTDTNYQLNSLSFSKQLIKGSEYIIGEMNTSIPEWKEPGAPIRLILQNSSDKDDISNETLFAFDIQNSFIKLYPNPFKKDLLIQYKLDKPATVKTEIISINNPNRRQRIDVGSSKSIGEHFYQIDGQNLPNGLYVIRMYVDKTLHTKLVVKQ